MPSFISIAGRSEIGNVTRINEDAFWVSNLKDGRTETQITFAKTYPLSEPLIAIVADGTNGDYRMVNPAMKVLTCVREQVMFHLNNEMTEDWLRGIVDKANYDFSNDPDWQNTGLGATVTCALFLHDQITFAQVGDTRGYLLRDNRLSQITVDQTYVEQLVQKGEITKRERRLTHTAM